MQGQKDSLHWTKDMSTFLKTRRQRIIQIIFPYMVVKGKQWLIAINCLGVHVDGLCHEMNVNFADLCT